MTRRPVALAESVIHRARHTTPAAGSSAPARSVATSLRCCCHFSVLHRLNCPSMRSSRSSLSTAFAPTAPTSSWRASPDPTTRARNAPCRPTTRSSASRSRSHVRSSGVTNTNVCAKESNPGASISRWAIGINGARPPCPPPAAWSRPKISRPSTAGTAEAAIAATVRCSNTILAVVTSPARLARDTTWMETMLSPPRAKKSSSADSWVAESRPSTSRKTAAMMCSAAVLSSRPWPLRTPRSIAGRARWSSLPFAVIGSASTRTNTDGTMWAGSVLSAQTRSAASSGCPSESDSTAAQ